MVTSVEGTDSHIYVVPRVGSIWAIYSSTFTLACAHEYERLVIVEEKTKWGTESAFPSGQAPWVGWRQRIR